MDEVVDILVTTYNTNEKQKPLQKIEIFSKKFLRPKLRAFFFFYNATSVFTTWKPLTIDNSKSVCCVLLVATDLNFQKRKKLIFRLSLLLFLFDLLHYTKYNKKERSMKMKILIIAV